MTMASTTIAGGRAVRAQGIDCNRLQAQIARLDRGGGGRGATQVRRAGAELARTQAYAHQLGCDGFSFFGSNPECGGLNQRIRQLQASVGQLQAGGGGGGLREDLIVRFNAACRQQPQPRGFFESLFGGGEPQPPAALPPPPSPPRPGNAEADDDDHAHGGSQAVCVRTCDGGFFPLAQSTRHSAEDLNDMCAALCPGTQAAVYTRNPNAEIKTALSLDGHPYMNMPNAMKFSKSFTPACSCHPEGKTWAEALAGAEEALGNARKGDIVVTQEKSDELAHQKSEPKMPASAVPTGARTTSSLDAASAVVPQAGPAAVPEAVKRAVRQVGPQP